MEKKYNRREVKQQNYTKGGKQKATLYFTPSFVKGLKSVCQSQNIGMSYYIEENLRKQLNIDKKKLDSKT